MNIGFDGFTVNINDRRMLRGALCNMGFAPETLDSVCISFDKMDKIGAEGVRDELKEKEFTETAVQALYEFMLKGDITVEDMKKLLTDTQAADNLQTIIDTATRLSGGKYAVQYAPSLVRGQGYYTGCVFEITCDAFKGAIAGGGGYDGMVGKFLGVQVPAVGFSIGFERICGILAENKYSVPRNKKIALLYLPEAPFDEVLAKAAKLRESYSVTVLKQAKKLGKQFGTLQNAGYYAAAFFDNDEMKVLGDA